MPEISGKMNPREREIGERLRAFRKGICFSQDFFAEQIGISRDQLAAIEYGRTPIKYSIAWRIRDIFGLSVDWLWGGDMWPNDLSEDQVLPLPNSIKIGQNALLTEVFKQVHNVPDDLPGKKFKPKKIKVDKAEIDHRWFRAYALILSIDEWVARVPDGYTADFCNKIDELAEKYLSSLPKDSEEIVDARFEAIRWIKMRSHAIRKLPAVQNSPGVEKSNLTKRQIPESIGTVKSLWQLLKQRLQSATAEAGKKSELASFLKVDLSLVSRWLGETKHAREPGAEYTLKMLHWVEQQER